MRVESITRKNQNDRQECRQSILRLAGVHPAEASDAGRFMVACAANRSPAAFARRDKPPRYRSYASSVAIASVVPQPLHSYELHEKRDVLPETWSRSRKLNRDELIPLRFHLQQQNIDAGVAHLLDIRVLPALVGCLQEVRSWLEESGVNSSRFSHSTSRASLQFHATVEEAERLLRTQFHEYTDAETGSASIGCDSYYLPSHIRTHIHSVTPDAGVDEQRQRQACETEAGSVEQALQPVTVPRLTSSRQSIASTTAAPLESRRHVFRHCTKSHPSSAYRFPATPWASFKIWNRKSTRGITRLTSTHSSRSTRTSRTVRIRSAIASMVVWSSPKVRFLKEVKRCWITMLHILWFILRPLLLLFRIHRLRPAILAVHTAILSTHPIRKHSGSALMPFLDSIDREYCESTGGDKAGLDCGKYTVTNVLSFSYEDLEVFGPFSYEDRVCTEFMKLGLQGVSVLFRKRRRGVGLTGSDECGGSGATANKVYLPNR
ncbi:hypothetical protein MRB53_040712 [Persea americana]|nr:hypothetical protein MRB53_040712 [Persea americana]